jgi:signal transduction histidine kinase
MLGKNIEVLIQPDNRSEIRELMNIVRRGKGINRYESGRVRKDGRVIDVSASLSPTKDLDGRVTGAATITRDISLQRKGEAQLLAHTMQLEALHGISQEIAESLSLAEMMPRALKTLAGILPFEFAFAYCATRAGGPGEIFAAERRTDHGGYVSQELQNSLDTILRQVNAEWFVEDVAAVPELAGAVMSQGVMSLAVMPLQAAERTWGNLAVASRKVHPFTVEEVQFLRALARQIALGLENARLYEASLEFNRELAGEIEERKRAEKQLANFHAMVVHDLRAPLSNVISMTESVREGLFGAVNELQKKWLGKIETNCRSLIENVSDVLDVAKIEAGQLDIKPASMDLAANVREAVNEYSVEADKRGIRLVLTVDDDLPLLRADARRIDQVLTNLLSNALKFTKAGGEIRVAATRAAGAAVVSVADTGVGIPADEIGKLFEMYRQSSNHRSTEQRSSGVGLVICKKIVEGHGGRIWVDSVAGHGSKFSFSLPVAAEARDWATPA